jgi:hypothetical protein
VHCGAPVAALPAGKEAATSLVEQQQLGRNLISLGWIVAIQTTTFAVLVNNLGQDGAATMLRAKLEAHRGAYQKVWDSNLAAAYANHLTVDELHSLAKYGSNSPYASRVHDVQNDVGREMESASKSILTSYVSEALMDALKSALTGNSNKR